MNGLSLDAAMDLYAGGEDRAFERVYELLAPRLFGFLYRRTRNPAHAEDLVQQTMLQMHRARGTYLPGASVMAWSFAIGRRLQIDSARKAKREAIDPSDPGGAIDGQRDADTAELQLVARQTAAELRRVIEGLCASQREAYSLVQSEGLSYAEAAEVLGISVPAVRLRLFHANEALRTAVVQGNTR